jgi:hypothetical protein
MSLLAGMAVIGGAATLFAQGGPKPAKAEGMLMLQDKNYPLTHALAYETTINEEEVIAVVLSGQAIPCEKLKEAIEKEKDGGYPDFKRPTSNWSSQRQGRSSCGAPAPATPRWAGVWVMRRGN